MTWGLTIYISLIFLSAVFIFVERKVKVRYWNVYTYKYSTDYERLRTLLDDGLKVVRIYEDKNGIVDRVKLMYKTNYNTLKNKYYVDSLESLSEDVTNEKFINYCAFNEVKYLEPYSIQKGNKVKNSMVCEEE